MASGVHQRVDSPVLIVAQQNSLSSIQEEDSESTDSASGHLALHRSLDSFFPNSQRTQKPFPKKKLFDKLLDEHNELKREVAILKMRNWELEQKMLSLHAFVMRRAYPQPAPPFYMPTEPQSPPRATSPTYYYPPIDFNVNPPPIFSYPSGYDSPPRSDSPTEFSRQNTE